MTKFQTGFFNWQISGVHMNTSHLIGAHANGVPSALTYIIRLNAGTVFLDSKRMSSGIFLRLNRSWMNTGSELWRVTRTNTWTTRMQVNTGDSFPIMLLSSAESSLKVKLLLLPLWACLTDIKAVGEEALAVCRQNSLFLCPLNASEASFLSAVSGRFPEASGSKRGFMWWGQKEELRPLEKKRRDHSFSWLASSKRFC